MFEGGFMGRLFGRGAPGELKGEQPDEKKREIRGKRPVDAILEELKDDPNIEQALANDAQAEGHLRGEIIKRLDAGLSLQDTMKEVSRFIPDLIHPKFEGMKTVVGETLEPELSVVEGELAKPEAKEEPAWEPLVPDLASFSSQNLEDLKSAASAYLEEGLKNNPEAYKAMRDLAARLDRSREEIIAHHAQDLTGPIRTRLDALRQGTQDLQTVDLALRDLVDRKLANIGRKQKKAA